MRRRQTKKWDAGAGKRKNLSYAKMKATVALKHPREFVGGEPRLMSLCTSTGGLLRTAFQKTTSGFDDFGIGVSIYFKLLKSLIIFFLICALCCTTLYYYYSNGNMNE